GERHLHLRFHATDAHDSEAVSRIDKVLEQGGFTDPGVPAKHENARLVVPHPGEQRLDRVALAGAPDQVGVRRRDRPEAPPMIDADARYCKLRTATPGSRQGTASASTRVL